MNFQFYLEKLMASEDFQKFMEEYKDAFPCSGFFCLDKEGSDNKFHFDYYIPSDKKIFSFQLENKVERVPLEKMDENVPSKIAMNYDFDFDFVEKLIFAEMELKGIKNKIQKVLYSLQNLDGKDFLIGTVFISGLGMIKLKYDINEKKITDFEKKSFFDFMKVVKGKV
jgi:hypothetical protein